MEAVKYYQPKFHVGEWEKASPKGFALQDYEVYSSKERCEEDFPNYEILEYSNDDIEGIIFMDINNGDDVEGFRYDSINGFYYFDKNRLTALKSKGKQLMAELEAMVNYFQVVTGRDDLTVNDCAKLNVEFKTKIQLFEQGLL